MTRMAVAILLATGFAASGAQAPNKIGLLPVLAPLPATTGACMQVPATPDLQRASIEQVLMLKDTMLSRLLSVGLDHAGHPIHLMSIAGVTHGRRREIETAAITFDASGRVVGGQRTYTVGGVPATRAEDQSSGLLPADSSAARRLAQAIRQRCAGRR